MVTGLAAASHVGPDALILANGSLARVPFHERVSAAATAGFDAIGLSLSEYERLLRDGCDERAMRTALREHGLQVAELEVLLGFAATGDDLDREPLPGVRYADVETEARFFEIATVFGARHLQVVGTFHSTVLEEHAIEAFAGLCDRAAAHGLLVALEFVPCTNVPDAGVASDLVRAAGRPNGGLCVDSWHHFRGRNDDRLLQAIPADKVVMIQLDDGSAEPVEDDFVTDTVRHRLPPGEGDFDLVRFLRILWDRGVRAPISVEVLSGTVTDRAASDVARHLATATRNVIDSARRVTSH